REKDSPDSAEPLYTLQIASKLSNTSVYSIRQYVDKGLIIPFTTAKNRHLFSNIDIVRLNSIRKNLHELGLNVAGIKALYSLIPCWKIKGCSVEAREKCSAYLSSTQPCWEASDKNSECINTNCRTCKVYEIPEKYQDLKYLFRKLIQ
ncbi:MerR family transcriptional regulator, partial [Bacteroidota bacterium]